MKAYRTGIKPKFEPVTLVLETQEEVDRLYAVFNHFELANILQTTAITNPLKTFKTNYYRETLSKLCDLIK